MQLFRQPLLYLFLTIISLILESVVGFDQFFQQPFYKNKEWMISTEFHTQYKWLLYTGIKICIIVFTVCLFLYTIFLIYTKSDKCKLWIKPLLLVVFSIAIIPLIVSFLKAQTGIYAPKELIPYGGNNEHIGFLTQMWKYGYTANGRCFPAGHASGGFALMSLYLLPVSNNYKKTLFSIGLLLGWFMGLYQMARGEHFISHTLFTMCLALFVVSILNKYILLKIA